MIVRIEQGPPTIALNEQAVMFLVVALLKFLVRKDLVGV